MSTNEQYTGNSIFSEKGLLSSLFEGFEHRPEQEKMSEFIEETLIEQKTGIIEAGTGTGKTFAYLIPSILHAKEHDLKISISTETKALQKQLVDRDIPIIQDILKEHLECDFTYALCMGSSNYMCLKRFDIAAQRGRIKEFPLKRIRALSKKGEVFSRFDIPGTQFFWSEVQREPDACRGQNCLSASRCPYQRARKEWNRADILVMNHYLFFTDVAMGRTYIPKTDIILFDEAHSLEPIGCATLGFSLTGDDLLELCSRFYQRGKSHELLNHITDNPLQKKARTLLRDIVAETSVVFEQMKTQLPQGAQHRRLRQSMGTAERLVSLLKRFLLVLADCEDDFSEESIQTEFDITRGRLFLYTENLNKFDTFSDESSVYWIEQQGQTLTGAVALRNEPVSISMQMKHDVLPTFNSAFFVSATLSLNKNFSFFSSALGIENPETLLCGSSFDYPKQMVAYISRDTSAPDSNIYSSSVSDICSDIINHLEGRVLILCTSYRFLEDLKNQLRTKTDHPIFSQDEMISAEALEQYKNEENGVLIGTNSFWQGIDLPGELLKGLIVTRLPFAVPDLPPVQARIELLKQQGLNPFMTYQLPEALLRFRQGIGRLIRTRNDKGILAILDSRVDSRPYGEIFLKSIPDCTRVSTPEELFAAYTHITRD